MSTGVFGFGVWAHHMFATGMPALSTSFFSAASMAVSIPSGIQIFAWLATIWAARRHVLATPMLFMLGFICLFVIGGVSGVMTASVPFDWQATDTYFVVAHLHYVLVGINLFPVFAGFYYWLPKMTGRMLNERLGQVELLGAVRRLQPHASSRCTSSGCSACRAASTPIPPGWAGTGSTCSSRWARC